MTQQPTDFDSLWAAYIGTGYDRITPAEWTADGWDMARILDYLRAWDGTPYELPGPAMMNVANAIAAGLEERGYPMRPALETITLTTHHGAPVAVLNGLAYGPEDMTPAGVTAAELVRQWAGRFIGQDLAEAQP